MGTTSELASASSAPSRWLARRPVVPVSELPAASCTGSLRQLVLHGRTLHYRLLGVALKSMSGHTSPCILHALISERSTTPVGQTLKSARPYIVAVQTTGERRHGRTIR